jgi:hypothetical protein
VQTQRFALSVCRQAEASFIRTNLVWIEETDPAWGEETEPGDQNQTTLPQVTLIPTCSSAEIHI